MTSAAIILGGGMALGAYQAGALAVLLDEGGATPSAVAGTSIGAINAAILVGNAPETRVERLLAFWDELATDGNSMSWFDPFDLTATAPMRGARSWVNVAASRLTGVTPLFRPRGPLDRHDGDVPSMYESEPAIATLERYVDFDRVNAGEVRCVINATDIVTGEAVVFDTAAGDRIGVREVLASSAMLPAFAPLEIDGRMLGDGGFSANMPFQRLLSADGENAPPKLAIGIDLFSDAVPPPRTLVATVARSTDLQFVAQTRIALEALSRERALDDANGTDLVMMVYQPADDEADPEKAFDFSHSRLKARISAGREAAQRVLETVAALPPSRATGLRIHRITPLAV